MVGRKKTCEPRKQRATYFTPFVQSIRVNYDGLKRRLYWLGYQISQSKEGRIRLSGFPGESNMMEGCQQDWIEGVGTTMRNRYEIIDEPWVTVGIKWKMLSVSQKKTRGKGESR